MSSKQENIQARKQFRIGAWVYAFVMLFVVAFIMLFTCNTVNAQPPSTDVIPVSIKIADETTLTERGNQIKIITTNKHIATHLIAHYDLCQCIKYTYKWSKDRNGKYAEWTIYLPADKKQEIIVALKK